MPPTASRVLPTAVTARVSVEAGIALPWRGIVGDSGRSVSIEHFGASADYKTLFEKFGITAEAVVAGGARDASRRTHEHPHRTPRRRGRQHLARRPVALSASPPATSPTSSTRATSAASPPTRRSSPGAIGHGTTAYDGADRTSSPRTARPPTRRSSRSRPTTCARAPTSSVPCTTPPDGVDGRVSIEVSPDLAHDTDGDHRAGQGAVGRRSTARTRSSRSPRPRPACPPSPRSSARASRSTSR